MSDEKEYGDQTTSKVSLFDIGGESIEFKPLTTGLGFKDTVSANLYTEEVQNNSDFEILSDAGILDIGKEDIGDGEIDVTGDTLKLQTAETLSPIVFHSGHDGLVKRSAKKTKESFFGIFIDSLIAFSLAVCVSALIFDQVKIEVVNSFSKQDLLNFLNIFITTFFVYRILSRVFFSRTLGEWACRHQLGDADDHKKIRYPFLIFIRECLTVGTGLFTFALLSLAFNCDIGSISGLHTFLEQKK